MFILPNLTETHKAACRPASDRWETATWRKLLARWAMKANARS